MKKLVVISDNHGDMGILDEIKIIEPDADYYIHCGDSEARTLNYLDGFVCVAGNNDWGLDLPKSVELTVENTKVFITHGQFYGYFDREKHMIKDLKKHKCTLMLSGHTHMGSVIKEGRFTFVNPGSTSWPRGGTQRSYAVIKIDDDKVVEANIINL